MQGERAARMFALSRLLRVARALPLQVCQVGFCVICVLFRAFRHFDKFLARYLNYGRYDMLTLRERPLRDERAMLSGRERAAQHCALRPAESVSRDAF